MQSIIKNPDHKAASEQLHQLTDAHNAAKLEETALLAQLNEHPSEKQSALERAKAMLTGSTPAPRQDLAGLNSRLADVREKLALLEQAIQEQRTAITGLVGAQSAVVNGERKADHIKSAARIKAALAGLRESLEAEQSLRAEIGAAGYLCSLEPLARPELNFEDSQATISRYLRDVDAYVMLNELAAIKTVNVRLLFGTGDDLPGDVLTMTGIEAAALVRIGHAEPTRDKPGRVARPVRESYGFALGLS